MIVAGVGFRRGVSADEIEQAVRLALRGVDVVVERLEAMATESGKAAEAAPSEAARRLGVPLIACHASELAGVAARVVRTSKHALQAKGLPSIAEASALVAAGRNARLLGRRIATDSATCAIAAGDGR